MSVDTIRCIGRKNSVKHKDESNPAYKDVSAVVTFLGQFKPEAAVLIGQLLVLAHEVVIHIPALIINALQKKNIRI
jgi:hypothetical protein